MKIIVRKSINVIFDYQIKREEPFNLLNRYRIIKLVQYSFMIRILRKLGKEELLLNLIKTIFKQLTVNLSSNGKTLEMSH